MFAPKTAASPGLTEGERERVARAVRDKYRKVAVSSAGQFRFPVGREGLAGLGYDRGLVKGLPPDVADCFCGVGNPFSLGAVRPGDRVLDIGCGAGVDALLAAKSAWPGGLAVGLEFTPAMTVKARALAKAAGVTNAAFVDGEAGDLPFEDESFDLVISNGVFNLAPDKPRALAEARRVLKPGGRLQIADQILTGPAPADQEEALSNWFR